MVFGGDACESNTPETFCAPHNGFEGRGAHQDPSISKNKRTTLTIIRQNGRKRCKMQKKWHLAERGPFPQGLAANASFPTWPRRPVRCRSEGNLHRNHRLLRIRGRSVLMLYGSGRLRPTFSLMAKRWVPNLPTKGRQCAKKPVISVQKGWWGEALPPSGNPGAQPCDRMRHRCRVGVGRMEAGGRGLTRAWGPARAGRRRGA